jgi:ATP-dependent DNA helicase RecQ
MATANKINECVIEMQNILFELKENQIKCLELLTSGKDVFAVLPTGYGKSIIYTILPKVCDLLEEIRTNRIVIVIDRIS